MTDLLDPTPPQGASLTPESILRFQHRLEASGLFSDEALEGLLDRHPRECLEVTTMGQRFEEGGWRSGDLGDLNGNDILRAIREGHLWLNVKELHRHHGTFSKLLGRLYREIGQVWGETPPGWQAATLLISSPRAFVHYHADSVPNILWQLRGRKRVYVYPVSDPQMAPPEVLEKICAGEKDEGLPYQADFDQHAAVIELAPGAAIAWPQNSPHRVENIEGVNVSLSTEHLTGAARRRVDLLRGNRLLRRRFGARQLSIDSHGLCAGLKILLSNSQRVLRRLRRQAPIGFELRARFRVDPDAPGGFVESKDDPLDAARS